MRPEDEVKKRMRMIFDMRNVKEMARRTGYPPSTIYRWKRDPLSIKAVDLIRLEQVTKIREVMK